jgi:two-component system OmpR family response regulator
MSTQLSAVVIEDDQDIRGLVTAIVTSRGVEVHSRATGEAGLAAVREHNPQLVILDFGLPDTDGLEVLARIREISDTPVLMLTAREDLADTVLAAGAAAFLAKPFLPGDLREKVQALLAV